VADERGVVSVGFMKWRRENLLSPITYTSDDGRFVIRKTASRYNIRPRPVTVTKIWLTDAQTGERYDGFRVVRDAKAKAEEIAGVAS
jgi:hypothetical protein